MAKVRPRSDRRKCVNGDNEAYGINDLNQAVTEGSSFTNAFDANGNLTQRTLLGAGVVERDYFYDDENRLVRAWYHFGYAPQSAWWETLFVYDGLGRLRTRTENSNWNGSSWVSSSTTRYIYDGKRVIQERNSSNTPTVAYTRGKDLSGNLEGAGGIGGLLARSHGYSGGTWSTHSFYHADGNGNVTCLIDSATTPTVVASYKYDPYGRTISQSGSLASANVYRFSSKELHANSGLYYYLYRFYDPSLQRWLNRDPLEEEGGVNLYRFTDNTPINRIDSFGLATPQQIEELKKQIELIQQMRDLANQMIDNFESCKPQCLGVSSVVAHYCNCYRDFGENCEDFAECVCVQLPDDRACKTRAVKACKIVKTVLDAYKKANPSVE